MAMCSNVPVFLCRCLEIPQDSSPPFVGLYPCVVQLPVASAVPRGHVHYGRFSLACASRSFPWGSGFYCLQILLPPTRNALLRVTSAIRDAHSGKCKTACSPQEYRSALILRRGKHNILPPYAQVKNAGRRPTEARWRSVVTVGYFFSSS